MLLGPIQMILDSDTLYPVFLSSQLVLTAIQTPKHIPIGHHAFQKLIWLCPALFRFNFIGYFYLMDFSLVATLRVWQYHPFLTTSLDLSCNTESSWVLSQLVTCRTMHLERSQAFRTG